MDDGVLVDLHEEDAEECVRSIHKREWINPRLPELMFGSDQVLATSTETPPWIAHPGIYFVIFRGRVVYVGQASHIGSRIKQHFTEGRPIDRLAFIVGIPRWALTEIEHAYIRAWGPPWNAERKRRGWLHKMPELIAAAEALDRSVVGEQYPVTVPHARFKAWQLHVMGWQQNQAKS